MKIAKLFVISLLIWVSILIGNQPRILFFFLKYTLELIIMPKVHMFVKKML